MGTSYWFHYVVRMNLYCGLAVAGPLLRRIEQIPIPFTGAGWCMTPRPDWERVVKCATLGLLVSELIYTLWRRFLPEFSVVALLFFIFGALCQWIPSATSFIQ